ncbi:hypothetical protein D3C71_1126140 [compost metagenome]
MFCNNIVQIRLCELRFITFVVTIFTVTQQIDEDITVEFLTVFHRDFNRLDHSLNIVSVYVEYGRKRCFRNVRTISR